MFYVHQVSKPVEGDAPTCSASCSTHDKHTAPSGVELESLITEVKDILPDLGDGFVQVRTYYSSEC